MGGTPGWRAADFSAARVWPACLALGRSRATTLDGRIDYHTTGTIDHSFNPILSFWDISFRFLDALTQVGSCMVAVSGFFFRLFFVAGWCGVLGNLFGAACGDGMDFLKAPFGGRGDWRAGFFIRWGANKCVSGSSFMPLCNLWRRPANVAGHGQRFSVSFGICGFFYRRAFGVGETALRSGMPCKWGRVGSASHGSEINLVPAYLVVINLGECRPLGSAVLGVSFFRFTGPPQHGIGNMDAPRRRWGGGVTICSLRFLRPPHCLYWPLGRTTNLRPHASRTLLTLLLFVECCNQ